MKLLPGIVVFAAVIGSISIARAVRAADLEVRALMPGGAQRGTTVEVAVSGKLDRWPLQAWVDRPGLSVTATADKGKLQVTSNPGATSGVYWIRLYDAGGAAAPRPFVLGTLPEVIEQEPNNGPSKAQAVASPGVVVNGRFAASGDVDTFAVTLEKGQTLVASLAAHETLGSPMDSVLELVAPRGNVLAYNHDQNGLDPRIEFAAPTSGTYLVRGFAFPSTPNSTIAFAGGDQYVYRLTLTTGPFVDYPWPLAVTRRRQSQLELVGWNLPEPLRFQTVKSEWETLGITGPDLPGAVPLAVEAYPTLVEVEPNGPDAPQAIELPATVSGRIAGAGDVDAFGFVAKQGEPIALQVESRSLGFPLDAVMEVTDATGKSLAKIDDSGGGRDPSLTFTPPADGPYRVIVSDLNRQGSSRHAYGLRAVKAQGDFELAADSHAYTVAVGKPTEITLTIARLSGFAEDIDFTAQGLPSGAVLAPARSAAQGDSSKTVKLSLSASNSPFSGPFRIVGRSQGTSALERTAGAALPVKQLRTSELWLTVVPAGP